MIHPLQFGHSIAGVLMTSIAGILTALLVVSATAFSVAAQEVEEIYLHGPDSMESDAVPHGTVIQHEWLESKVFPGTKRRYSVYVPAQYDGETPAALMVFQDGQHGGAIFPDSLRWLWRGWEDETP